MYFFLGTAVEKGKTDQRKAHEYPFLKQRVWRTSDSTCPDPTTLHVIWVLIIRCTPARFGMWRLDRGYFSSYFYFLLLAIVVMDLLGF